MNLKYKFISEEGFISSDLTIDILNSYKEDLNFTHTDFKIKNEKLKNEIDAVKLDKKEILVKIQTTEAEFRTPSQSKLLIRISGI